MQKGYKETKIGIIPENWKVLSVECLSEIIMGQSPSSSDCNDFGDGIPFYQGNGEFGSKYPALKYWTTKPTKIVQPNDILMSVRAPVGDLNYSDNVCCIGRGLCAIRPNKNTNLNYIFYCLKKSVARLKRLEQGSTFTAVNKSDIKTFLIPIPPLSEQRKIAVILSTVDDAIEKTDAIIEETKQLKKGLMQIFFVNRAYMMSSKANKEPTNLKPIYLQELGKIVTGTTPNTKLEEYYNSHDYMFIGPADLGNAKRINTAEKYISNAGFNVARQLPKDTVMVVCIGATIGKVGIANKACATNQQINAILPSNEYSADYIYYLMRGIPKYLLAFAGDTATPIINKGEFSKVITFVHNSRDKRHQIAKILSEVDAKIEKEESINSELKQLKKGLMQVLLTGKVRVKV